MNKILNLYECRRGEGWYGALLILAKNKEDAIKTFEEEEGKKPYEVNILDLSREGIIYDDEMR